jgi:hypothetical protein
MGKLELAAIALAALAALCLAALPALSGAIPGPPIRVGDPYRGATLDFHEEPAVELIPSTMVYYVRNRECDLYRYGRYWYFMEGGLWFRARSWQGPFLRLQSTSVPRSVRTVPLNYRRHWPGPPPPAPVQGDHTKKSVAKK